MADLKGMNTEMQLFREGSSDKFEFQSFTGCKTIKKMLLLILKVN